MNATRIKILAEAAALIVFMSIGGILTEDVVPVLLILIIYAATRLFGHASAIVFAETVGITKGDHYGH